MEPRYESKRVYPAVTDHGRTQYSHRDGYNYRTAIWPARKVLSGPYKGFYTRVGYHQSIRVYWMWDEGIGYHSPQLGNVLLNSSSIYIKLLEKVLKVFRTSLKARNDPEAFYAALKAVIVVPDDGGSSYYKVARLPGEGTLAQITRALD